MTLVNKSIESFDPPKHKRDRKLISLQWWERYLIRWKYGVPKQILNDVILYTGKGRKKVYDRLRELGFLDVPNIL